MISELVITQVSEGVSQPCRVSYVKDQRRDRIWGLLIIPSLASLSLNHLWAALQRICPMGWA